MRTRILTLSAALAAGCGTTRQTDTTRAATEMLLVSQAIDHAVERVDMAELKGHTVYLDTEYLDKVTVDRGYLVSSLREKLLVGGAMLKDDSKSAEYVVELRAGGVGTDRSTFLIGTPALSVPAVIPGLPTSIPEIALYKRNDQRGVAKIGVFAYHKATGRAVWTSEIVQEGSQLKDRWLLGSGPYSTGTIRKRGQFAGDDLPDLPKIPLINAEHVVPPDMPSAVQPAAAVSGRP